MADNTRSDQKRPTLRRLKPGTPEYLEWQADWDRVAEPWRQELRSLDREELIEVAVAGARRVSALLATANYLSSRAIENRGLRSKGGLSRRPDQRQAKQEIYEKWRHVQTRARFDAGAFCLKMTNQAKYGKLIKYDTMMKWCRTWAREHELSSSGAPERGLDLDQNLPEIYRILGYPGPKSKK